MNQPISSATITSQGINKEALLCKSFNFKAHSNSLNTATKLFSLITAATLIGGGLVHKNSSLLDGIYTSSHTWAPWGLATVFSAIATKYLAELSQAYEQMSQISPINVHKETTHLKTN